MKENMKKSMKVRLHTLIALSVLVFSSSANANSASFAVWKEYETRFWYSGFSTLYSCDGLERKLGVLLREFGAHPDSEVHARGCYSGHSDVSKTLSVRVTMKVPVPANENDEGAFEVQQVEASVRNHSPRNIDRGDCELVEHFQRHLMGYFDHTLIRESGTCIPGHANAVAVHLEANVLRATEQEGGS